MRMWRIVLLALAGVRRSRLRVALTTLGVMVASGAMVTMVAVALGIQEQVETPFKTLGLVNMIRVSVKRGEDADGAAVLDGDPRVDLGRGNGSVAEDGLHVPDVGTVLEELRGAGVPQDVGPHPLLDLGGRRNALHGQSARHRPLSAATCIRPRWRMWPWSPARSRCQRSPCRDR